MKTRIQIIDDNVSLTTLLAKTFAKFGYEPVVENNPLLAINTARHFMPDIILLDVMMPERDGGRVLADLRADLSLRYIPVILLTAIAREAQALASMDGIKSAIIAKPVQLTELVDEIERQLAAVRTFSQQQDYENARIEGESVARAFVGDHHMAQLPSGGNAFGDTQASSPLVDLNNAEEEDQKEFSAGIGAPDFAFPERDQSKPTDGNAW